LPDKALRRRDDSGRLIDSSRSIHISSPAIEVCDLAGVLRDDIEPTRGVVPGLTDVWLRALPEDVRTADTGKVPRLDPEDLRRALAARDEG
jgi:hypothetical protein